MRVTSLVRFLGLAVFVTGACAQGVQNMDLFYLAGPVSVKSQVLPVSNVTISGSTGYGFNVGYGYQVMRTWAGSLWVEFLPMVFANGGSGKANIPGSTRFSLYTITPTIRFMVPVHSRVSIYGVLGGGLGSFRSPAVAGGSVPSLEIRQTWHGVLAIGGGVDFRLVRHISLRGEVRDFVTGAGLSGVAGRHHVLPLAGVALHF